MGKSAISDGFAIAMLLEDMHKILFGVGSRNDIPSFRGIWGWGSPTSEKNILNGEQPIQDLSCTDQV